ncbi:hypothetical protein O7626_00600 [Micromonospora sp. WMMD1102]|uniref:hypothetical protein n=1 Tax=Micromonospora sp. WMMD1102 TaxID=3016105 RepID=UPI0024154B96|nr:hypothetical protein [Micromonospora sp. WMMD1102]MDG4784446.1 hypothetical protein [Micromonospora sp. WMMD1102]
MTEQPPPTLADLTGQPAPRRPLWPWIAGAAAVLAAGLIGFGYVLGNDSGPAPAAVAATSPAPAPTPTSTPTDWTRDGCSRLAALGTPADPTEAWTAGEAAANSPYPGVAAAGDALRDAADAPHATIPGDGPLDIAEAELDLAEACDAIYGEGGW